jgi:hypothetical protein
LSRILLIFKINAFITKFAVFERNISCKRCIGIGTVNVVIVSVVGNSHQINVAKVNIYSIIALPVIRAVVCNIGIFSSISTP